MMRRSPKVTVENDPAEKVYWDSANRASDEALLEVWTLINRADDKAANDASYDSYEYICELLGRVDYKATGQSLGEDLPDVNELRLRLRKILVRGITALVGGMCLILLGFASLSI